MCFGGGKWCDVDVVREVVGGGWEKHPAALCHQE